METDNSVDICLDEVVDCSEYRQSYRCSCHITLIPPSTPEAEIYISLGSVLVRKDSIVPNSNELDNPLIK